MCGARTLDLVSELRTVADLIVDCLVDEGVTYVFGIPGEENIHLVRSLASSFGFASADVIVAVGYELQEFDPIRINPRGDTKIVHVHRFNASVDAHYDVTVAMVVLVWLDDAYGLIGWKMDLELGVHSDVAFGNPDLVAYATSFGARGVAITAAEQLLPALREALAADTVTVIACPVDYADNLRLTESLGELDFSLA